MKATHCVAWLKKKTPYICHNCRKPSPIRLSRIQRTYSTPSSPPPSSGSVLLKSRRLIHLSGPDSAHYLQGAITANVQSTNPRTTGFYAAFLNAQGRVLNDVFIYPLSNSLFTNGKLGDEKGADPGWIIEVDADEVEKLIKHIKKYKLRAKFAVRIIDPSEAGVWFTWNDSSSSTPTTTPSIPHHANPHLLDARVPNFGHRIILPSSQTPNQTTPETPIPEVDETSYKIRRYLHGIPEGQKEILRETALVQESNIDYMGGVDYRKGCYVGQELTIRTHHTGVVRKRILPLMLYGEGEEVPAELVYRGGESVVSEGMGIGRVGRKGRSAGKWLDGVGNLGLGLVRLEVMTGIVIQGEGGGYREGDEFKIEMGEGRDEGLRVKAFVPSWHLNR